MLFCHLNYCQVDPRTNEIEKFRSEFYVLIRFVRLGMMFASQLLMNRNYYFQIQCMLAGREREPCQL